jgi:hypothetical protein
MSGEGGTQHRVRETVTLRDPETKMPLTDFSVLRGVATTGGETAVDVNILVEGLGGQYPADQFAVRVEDGNGNVVWGPFDVDEPTGNDASIDLPARLQLPIQVSAGTASQELVAVLDLAEDSQARSARHSVVVDITAAFEALWSFQVAGLGLAEGDLIVPTTVAAPPGGPWQITLTQLGDNRLYPLATLALIGHPGRDPNCMGPTGTFDAFLSVQTGMAPTQVAAGGGEFGDDPECATQVTAIVSTFSREEDLHIDFSGTLCRGEMGVDGELVGVPAPFTGTLRWPEAGCGGEAPDPGEGFVGSYGEPRAPEICLDVYQNAAIAQSFDLVCAQGLSCSEDPCPTAGQIGECDYRAPSADMTFRGQIVHFYPMMDGPTAAELDQACTLQGGTWKTGP